MNHYEFLQVEASGGVATITLDRQPLNVLHNPMLDELNTALELLVDNEDYAAIVIRAKGKAFCAGADVADHVAENVRDMIHSFHSVFRKIVHTDAVTIAAVNGAALGGGCELACACDIVLASERAKFGQPEVQVGVFPPVAACSFPTRMGLGEVIEFIALGQTVDANEAQRIGLVNHVYLVDDFDNRVEAFLAHIGELSRPVVRMAKKAVSIETRQRILDHLDLVEHLYLDELMELSDPHAGIAAFMAKRPAVWQHA